MVAVMTKSKTTSVRQSLMDVCMATGPEDDQGDLALTTYRIGQVDEYVRIDKDCFIFRYQPNARTNFRI